jgi:hypothetical protein
MVTTPTEAPDAADARVEPPGQVTDTVHPITWFARRAGQVLDGLADVPTWSMTTGEQGEAVLLLHRLQARTAELELRVLAQADRSDVAAETAARSTAAWLAHETTQDPAVAHRQVRLAQALDERYVVTQRALAKGRIGLAHAQVVVRALDALPGWCDEVLRDRAEQTLLEQAQTLTPAQLAVAGRHVAHVLDPQAADRHLGEQLAREEAAAARSCSLQLHDNGDGSVTGKFKVPALHAAMLTKALQALDNPALDRDPTAERTRRPRPERRGAAFCQLLERMPADRLPQHGGVSATVVVLIDHEALMSGIGTAGLDTGLRISAGEARRLACTAGIIPVVWQRVLGGASVVLDVGRKRRFHDGYQRIALAIQSGGTCTATGCGLPASMCHAHHDIPFGRGGPTDVEHGRLLCGHHHRRAHSPAYTITRHPSGEVSFHRRT